MRFARIGFILLALYFTFIGGSAYYALVFPIRVFHHIFVTLLLSLWLINRLRKGKGLPETPLNRPLYGVVIVWLLSAALSLDPRMAFENLWFPLTHIAFFFSLVDLFQRGRARLVMETQFMMAALVVFISGLEITSWYFGLGIIPGTDVGWIEAVGAGIWLPLQAPRLALAMNISTLLAGYIAPLIILAAGWALTTHRRDYRTVLWILAGLLLTVLLLTFSRGGLLSLLGAVGALIVLRTAQSQRISQRLPARWLIGVAVVGVLATATLFMVFTLSQSRRSGDEGRVDMWISALEITRDHPLLGAGPGLFGRAFREYRDPSIARDKLASAHNAYLNTLAETGILGMIASLWLGVTFVITWWHTWKRAQGTDRKLRLEVTFAAFVGLGIHSLVDVFTVTPIVLLIAVLAAYSITGQRSRLDRPPAGQKLPAVLLLTLIIGYGIWFIQLDRAQSAYQRSLAGGEDALALAREAHALDPALRLYDLQIAHLVGQQALAQTPGDLTEAVLAYQAALDLEPTWATGWINLAALTAQQGNNEQALAYLERAHALDNLNSAELQWAILAEKTGLAPEEAVLDAYKRAAGRNIQNTILPLSPFWSQSALRREAVLEAAARLPLDERYRVLAAHAPEELASIVPALPQSAAEWWVVGEYALSIEQDAEKAFSAFTEAISLAHTNGDYYASRARAALNSDPGTARSDLNIAQLLGTVNEYPNAIRVELAADEEEIRSLRIRALPARSVGQEFAAVLFGRPAQFDVFPQMRRPGPGRAALQPWYELAEAYASLGQYEDAQRVYKAIQDYDPYDPEAGQALQSIADHS